MYSARAPTLRYAGAMAATTLPIVPRLRTRSSEPSIREVLTLALAGAAIFVVIILAFESYGSAVVNFGDSNGYIAVARAIRHWHFDGLQIKQFWGYSYAMAALSLVTRLPVEISLLVISVSSCVFSIIFAHRLWGGWIAALFAILNFDWIQRCYLGGSEPLSVALILGAFLAVRKERFLLAATLASFATVVRPLSVFSLLAILAILLYRRDFKRALVSAFIGGAVALLYVTPLLKYFGDPLATVHSYGSVSRPLFGIPFYAIIEGTILYRAPWTNLLLSFGWIALITFGLIMMARDEKFRVYARAHAVEVLFAVPYLVLVYCYNYPVFARGSFARFAIPALPLVYLALSKWIPRDRRVIWALGLICPALAAASAIGIQRVLLRLH